MAASLTGEDAVTKFNKCEEEKEEEKNKAASSQPRYSVLQCNSCAMALNTEFLKVTVSRSCDRAKFSEFAQNLEICMQKLKIYAF